MIKGYDSHEPTTLWEPCLLHIIVPALWIKIEAMRIWGRILGELGVGIDDRSISYDPDGGVAPLALLASDKTLVKPSDIPLRSSQIIARE
jgi:hypothetical protein